MPSGWAILLSTARRAFSASSRMRPPKKFSADRCPITRLQSVMVGISLWDMDHKSNMRADLSAEEVTERGFHLVFRTWGDTRVAQLRADWTAIGPLRDEDLWEVD